MPYEWQTDIWVTSTVWIVLPIMDLFFFSVGGIFKAVHILNLISINVNLDQKPVLSGEEQERKITTYEGAMMKIKDATGVSDIRVCSSIEPFILFIWMNLVAQSFFIMAGL